MKNTTEWKQILAGQYEKMGKFEKVFKKIKCFFIQLLCRHKDLEIIPHPKGGPPKPRYTEQGHCKDCDLYFLTW
jgi:hypothetical protein